MEATVIADRPKKTTFVISVKTGQSATMKPSDFESYTLVKANHQDGLDLIYAWDGDYHRPEADGSFLGYYVKN
ncbi:MAG: hypothetical protein JWL92_678 [Candidatus Nomurabacteria bacterium]|nr:hypothetical protein [Candidatus Nomurabacteria bacterium]